MQYNRYVHELNAFQHVVHLAQYGPGTIVRVVEHREITRPQFVGRYVLRCRYPTLRRRLTLSWPPSIRLRAGLEGAEGCRFRQSRHDGAERHSLVIEADTLDAIGERILCAVPERWYTCLHVSFPPSENSSLNWKALGDHYLDFVAEALAPSERVSDIAERWRGLTLDAAVATAFDYVRETIRYYGDWRHIYAFVPRPADVVLAKGYGDCKEMALVLMSLLRTLDLDARLALVSTSGFFQPLTEYPTLGAFNHVIVAVIDSQGTPRYYDPTNVVARAWNSFYHLIGRRVLILHRGSSRIDSIAYPPDYVNEIRTSSVIRHHAPDGWRLHGRVVLSGHAALLWHTRNASQVNAPAQQVRKTFLEQWLGIVTDNSAVTHTTDTNVVMEFEADFGEHVVGVTNPVFVLDAPRARVCSSPFADPAYEGPRLIRRLVQHDRWKLPTTHMQLNTKELNRQPFTGTWRKNGDTVERLTQITPSLIEGDAVDEYRALLKNYATFTSATVSE